MYINDLKTDLKCNVKLFANDTYLFTIVQEPNAAAVDMNHDLKFISQRAHDLRMSFNPYPQKQAFELLLSKKRNEMDHPVILFNNIPVKKVTEHKHVGIILHSKLPFSANIKFFFYTQFKNFTKMNYLRHYLQHTLLHYKDDTPGSIIP